MNIAWLLARQTLRRRTASWILIGLTVALAGGVTLGCLAAARRTASTHERYQHVTSEADLQFGTQPTCDDRECTADDFAAIDGVATVAKRVRLAPLLEQADGAIAPDVNSIGLLGLTRESGWTVDQPLLTAGRLPAVDAADETFVDTAYAAGHNLQVGDTISARSITLDDDTFDALAAESQGGPKVGTSVPLRVTGIGVLGSDLAPGGTVVVSAAAAEKLAEIGPIFGLRLSGGSEADERVAAAIEQRFGLVPDSTSADAHAHVQRAVRPYVVALVAYAVLAALVGLALVAQAASRQTRASADEGALLHAIGVTHSQRRAGLLVGVVFAAAGGALVAAVLALVSSAWTPIGPVSPFEPDGGLVVDLTVLALGTLAWVAVVSAAGLAAILVADRSRNRERVVADVPLARRLPITTATAVRFARPASTGAGGNGARAAVAGIAMSALVLSTVLTFAAGLNRLVDTPRLYGWTYDASIFLGNLEDGGQQAAAAEVLVPQLSGEPTVAGVTELASSELTVDGRTINVAGTSGAGGAFTVTSGHPPSAPDEVVLGPDTASGIGIGSTVHIEQPADGGSAADFIVVGRAAFPESSEVNAWLTREGLHTLAPDAVTSQLGIRFDPGTSTADTAAVIDRAGATARQQNVNDAVLEVPVPPSDTDGLVGIGRLPVLLGLALAVATMVTIAHTLLLALRARRRDLATLRTFGYTRRQVWSTVLWQSALITGVGVAIGLPLGLTLGRRLWSSWASSIGVVDSAVSPLAVLGLLGGAAVAAALVVGILPARRAATACVADVLRTE